MENNRDPAASKGNVLRVVEHSDGPRLLKIYRRRRGRMREALAALSHFAFEGKRGVSPEDRRETERLGLSLWEDEGFSVPHVFDSPPPSDVDGPSLWLEYLEGRSLWESIVDPEVAPSRKEALVRQLGAEHCARHRRALALGEPLLLHEHPTVKHVLVVGERLVTIDLEGAYSARHPVLRGVANELAGFIRSMWVEPTPCFEARLTRAYVEGYANPSLMLQAYRSYSRGVFAWFRRMSDRWRRGRRAKSGVMKALSTYIRSESPALEHTESKSGPT